MRRKRKPIVYMEDAFKDEVRRIRSEMDLFDINELIEGLINYPEFQDYVWRVWAQYKEQAGIDNDESE